MTTKNKIIILDFGIFSHRAIFASVNNPKVPSSYTCLNMMLGNLKKIGVDEEDTIIIACDGRKSWRKEFDPEYKANRAEKRAQYPIDWDNEFYRMDVLLENLDISTSWHIIKLHHIEADDIMAVACRYYKNSDVVLVTYDSDLEQCWTYDNVKIFSPKSHKWKIKPENFNVYKIIAKKIEKETCDNLVSPILNTEDYKTREACVKLIELPEWVEKKVNQEFKNLYDKCTAPDYFPSKYLKESFLKLCEDKSKIVDYQTQIEKEQKKKDRILKKKQLEKAKKKKLKEKEKKKN